MTQDVCMSRQATGAAAVAALARLASDKNGG
jgi:hypothetical protein